MGMEGQIDRFLSALQTEKSFTQNTIAAYRNDLRQFAGHLRDRQGVTNWGGVTQDHLVIYLLYLNDRGYKCSTVACKTVAMMSYFYYLDETGHVPGVNTSLL